MMYHIITFESRTSFCGADFDKTVTLGAWVTLPRLHGSVDYLLNDLRVCEKCKSVAPLMILAETEL